MARTSLILHTGHVSIHHISNSVMRTLPTFSLTILEKWWNIIFFQVMWQCLHILCRMARHRWKVQVSMVMKGLFSSCWQQGLTLTYRTKWEQQFTALEGVHYVNHW